MYKCSACGLEFEFPSYRTRRRIQHSTHLGMKSARLVPTDILDAICPHCKARCNRFIKEIE